MKIFEKIMENKEGVETVLIKPKNVFKKETFNRRRRSSWFCGRSISSWSKAAKKQPARKKKSFTKMLKMKRQKKIPTKKYMNWKKDE